MEYEIDEFWTSKQRQASSIHEISYRACFKPQLPAFFIDTLTSNEDIVFDPFSGRGTTIIETVLKGRIGYANDVNPLSKILAEPRVKPPKMNNIKKRISAIELDKDKTSDIDLTMFYHKDTLGEIVSLKSYLNTRGSEGSEDEVDKWIRMVSTNRLTGHSKGFFSVYTLPPNQAASQSSQIKINEKKQQIPEYRNVKEIILKKSKQLLSKIKEDELLNLNRCGKKCKFFTCDARSIPEIESNTIKLTVTSPPFLDVVNYSSDNWLRCWFNGIDAKEISQKITMSKNIKKWTGVMFDVLKELYRITQSDGFVAFEVGEVKKGKLKLEDYIIPIGLEIGFECLKVMINSSSFTKTSNIWGIQNNEKGTNTNRIVLFKKN